MNQIHYISDLGGRLHTITDNIQSKLQSVAKSRDYWKNKLNSPDSEKARVFYNKFSHLYNQICILRDKSKATL